MLLLLLLLFRRRLRRLWRPRIRRHLGHWLADQRSRHLLRRRRRRRRRRERELGVRLLVPEGPGQGAPLVGRVGVDEEGGGGGSVGKGVAGGEGGARNHEAVVQAAAEVVSRLIMRGDGRKMWRRGRQREERVQTDRARLRRGMLRDGGRGPRGRGRGRRVGGRGPGRLDTDNVGLVEVDLSRRLRLVLLLLPVRLDGGDSPCLTRRRRRSSRRHRRPQLLDPLEPQEKALLVAQLKDPDVFQVLHCDLGGVSQGAVALQVEGRPVLSQAEQVQPLLQRRLKRGSGYLLVRQNRDKLRVHKKILKTLTGM